MRKRLDGLVHSPGLWLIIIVVTGSIVRLGALDRWPLGMHQDEAFSAYNAWSVMHYGMDSEGYVRPVYYTASGGGMSILYSYLQMPFIAILGTTVWAVRLPQAILGCVSIVAAYFLGKELYKEWMGVAFAGMVAINPWHILQSRFGLDANLAVPMLLFAFVFLCRYLNGRRKSLLPATIFFGLTLYSYVITWPLVPLVLVLTLIFFRKRIQFNKGLAGCILLLFVMALPLMLFMAINYELIPEIRTFLFSIPKLVQMRAGEFGFDNFVAHVKWMLAMLWAQHDDIWYITNSKVGAYYFISTPFILWGLILQLKALVDSLRKKKELPLSFILAIWFGAMFFVSCGIDFAKYYKVNCLHLPIIFCGVYGLASVVKALQKIKWLPVAVCAVYMGFFGYFLYTEISFPVVYENYGQPRLSHMLWNEYEDAIQYAEELTDGEISIIDLSYANVLLCTQTPPQEFVETVEFMGDDLAFREVSSFGRYHFGVYPTEETKDWVYVLPYYVQEVFEGAGYTVEHVTGCYGVAYLR